MESVSVVIPCFNSEGTIVEAIQSVVEQSYPVTEIIVVDDGSKDNSVLIVKKYFPTVQLIQQSNRGVSAARNVGIKAATSNWIAFLDADDIWLPEKLAVQFDSLNGEKWSHTNSFYFGHNQSGSTKRSDLSTLRGGDVFNELLVENFLGTSTILIEKAILVDAGGFDESFPVLEDWKLWLSLAIQYPISYVEDALVKYRVTPGSTSRKAREVYPYHDKLIRLSISLSTLSNKEKSRLQREALYKSNLICSYIAEDGKDYSYAVVCALRALKFKPTEINAYKRILSSLVSRFMK